MTDDDEARTPPEKTPTPQRRGRLVLAALLAVPILAAGAMLASAWGSQPASVSPSTSPTPSDEASPSPTPTPDPGAEGSVVENDTPSPTPAPEDNEFGTPIGDRAPLDGTAAVDGSVQATLVSVEAVTAEGQRAGEKSGPATAVSVELSNPTTETFSLGGVAVNLYYGDSRSPAAPIDEGTGFEGALEPGASATARYLFSVPEGSRDRLVVTVLPSADSPLLVFE